MPERGKRTQFPQRKEILYGSPETRRILLWHFNCRPRIPTRGKNPVYKNFYYRAVGISDTTSGKRLSDRVKNNKLVFSKRQKEECRKVGEGAQKWPLPTYQMRLKGANQCYSCGKPVWVSQKGKHFVSFQSSSAPHFKNHPPPDLTNFKLTSRLLLGFHNRRF